MTSVGSVSIDLSLDDSQFQRSLQSLSGTQLKPLSVGVSLDRLQLDRDLASLSNLAVSDLKVAARLDTSQAKADLKELSREVGNISVEARLRTEALRRDLSSLIGGQIEIGASLDTRAVRRDLKQLLNNQEDAIAVNAVLDRTQLDRDLDGLSRLAVKPLKVDAALDTSTIKDELRSLSEVERDISVHVSLDNTSLRRDIQSIASTEVALQATLDTKKLRRELEALIGQDGGELAVKVDLDRDQFNREVRAFENTKIKPLTVEATLNSIQLNREIDGLSALKADDLVIGTKLDTALAKNELQSLSRTAASIAVEAHLNAEVFRDGLEKLLIESPSSFALTAELDHSQLDKDISLLSKLTVDKLAIAASLELQQPSPIRVAIEYEVPNQPKLNNPTLKPLTIKVDDSRLFDLNEHLELKKEHFDAIQKHFDSYPLTIKVNSAEEGSAVSEINTLKQQLAGIKLPQPNELAASIQEASQKISTEIPLSHETQVRATVDSKTYKESVDTSGIAGAARPQLEQGFQGVAAQLSASINEAIKTSLKNLGSIASAPFQKVATGLFEGVGLTISQEITKGIIGSFQKTLDISFRGIGGDIGGIAAKEVGKALGLKNAGTSRKRRRGDDTDEQSGGQVRPGTPRSSKGGLPGSASQLEKELQEVGLQLGTFSNLMSKAGGGADKFGVGAAKAAQNALELASAIAALHGAIKGLTKESAQESSKKSKAKKSTSPDKSPQTQSKSKPAPVTSEESAIRVHRGFLKGDRASLQPEDARKQIESVRARLEKQLTQLQQVKGISADVQQKRIASLYKAISILEQRIAADIANPEIPKAVRQSLGQLKGTSSKLQQTRIAVEAEQQKLTGRRRRTLPGLARAGIAGGIGSSVLGAGGAMAAPGAGIGGLGFLGSLPFDPTLGLATAGIVGALGAGRAIPGLLRRAGATKVAATLETPVTQLLQGSVKDTLQQVQQSIGRAVSNLGSKLKLPSIKPLKPGVIRNLTGKLDVLNKEIDDIIRQVQAELIKKGSKTSLTDVRKGLETGTLRDRRYAAASAERRYLEGQINRNYNDVTQGKPRTGVNRASGIRRLIAKDDPIFQKLQESQREIDSVAKSVQAQLASQGQKLRLSTVKTLLRSGAVDSPEYARFAQRRAELNREFERRSLQAVGPRPADGPPEQSWNRFFRSFEARFYRSPIFSGNVKPSDRRSLTSEATGFLFSGATLIAPGATLGALSVPIVTALAPLATTLALVANAVKPLVGVVSQTLQQTQPIQARLEYASGGKAAAAENKSFVQGIAEKYNVSSLSSLEQFSRLSAAVKGTRLEGKSLKDLFEGIAVAAKGLQLNTADLNLVMYAFTQIASKGKLSAEEVRLQLAEKFPGIVSVISNSLNLSIAEFTDLLEKGKLLATDVLPKLGEGLKKEYGQAAVNASKNFLGALTKVENAIFKIREGIASSLAPIFTTVASSLGDTLNLVAQYAKQIVPIFSVALIGVSAQFFVGLTTILEKSGLTGKLQSFLIPAFGRLFATLTPFTVGIVADFLDDVLGAQTSVIQNLMQGTYNIVLGSILTVAELSRKISELFSGFSQNTEGASGLSSAFSSVFSGLKNITKVIPSTAIEFTALTLIMAQTYVLAREGLNVVLTRLGTTIAGLGTSFISSVRSGQIFSTTLRTLAADLKLVELRNVAATAAFVLFFAKADFSNELGSKFDKLGSQLTENLNRIREAALKTKDAFNNFKLPELKSKGFDLTVGLGEAFGSGPFRTDDLVKQMRDSIKQYNQAEFIAGRISKQELNRRNNSASEMRTIAENQFDQNLLKLSSQADEANATIDASGLLNTNFGTTNAGKALAGIKVIDSAIKQLQRRKVDLLSGADASSQEVIDQVARIDIQVRDLLGKRNQIKEPIETVRASVLDTVKILKDTLKEINDSGLPQPFKEQARNVIQPALDIAEKAKSKLEGLNAIDLSPLGEEFTKVTKEVEKVEKALERTLGKLNLQTTQAQAQIQADLASGKITVDTAARETTDVELTSLNKREKELSTYVNAQKANLRQLLAVPEPTPDQKKEIERVQKDVEGKELELAQTRLQRNQKTYEGKRQGEDRLLRDFQRTNTQAQLTAQNAEAQRQTRIKQRQLAGEITPSQAELEISASASATAKSDLAEANRQLKEFAALKKTGRLGVSDPADIIQQELGLNKQVSDASLRLIEAEIAAREQAKQKRIQGLEEIRTAEQATIDVERSNATNRIKQRQLQGEITPDTAAAEIINVDIKATTDSIESTKKRLADIAKLRTEGTYNASLAAEKEKEVWKDLAQYEGQLIDQRLQKQQQARVQALRDLEVANRRAEAVINSSQIETEIAIKRNQLKNAPTEDADQYYGIALDQTALDATAKQIALAQTKISQLESSNFETEQEYQDRSLELQTELGNLRVQQADEQIALDRRVYEQAIKNIQKRTQYEEDALDRTKQLLQSRLDLTKSLSEAQQTINDSQIQVLEEGLDLRRRLSESEDVGQQGAIASLLNRLGVQGSELDIIRQKQQLEDQSAAARLKSLQAEQQLTRTLTELDLRRERIAAQQAVSEAQTAYNRALVARLDSVQALQEAEDKGEQALVDAATERLRLNDLILKSTQEQFNTAKANLGIQAQLADETIRALNAEQRAATVQAQNTERVREAKQDLELTDIQFPLSGSSSSTPTEVSSGSSTLPSNRSSEVTRTKPLSLFEQSRLKVFAPPDIKKTVGGGVVHNANIDQSKHQGLNPLTSVESYFKRQLGDHPQQSAEAYFQQARGLKPGQSVEDYFNQLSGLIPRQLNPVTPPVQSGATPPRIKPTLQVPGLQKTYEAIYKAVSNFSGIKLDKLPKLIIDDAKLKALGGASGAYDSGDNAITISSKLAQVLKGGLQNLGTNFKPVSSLVHEIRHALQDSGRLPRLYSPTNLPASLQGLISKSVEATQAASGNTLTDTELSAQKAKEADAYYFAHQFTRNLIGDAIAALKIPPISDGIVPQQSSPLSVNDSLSAPGLFGASLNAALGFVPTRDEVGEIQKVTLASELGRFREATLKSLSEINYTLIGTQILLESFFGGSPDPVLPLGIAPTSGVIVPNTGLTESASTRGLKEAGKPTNALGQTETSGFRTFVEGLQEANRGIESRLDQLNQTMSQAMRSPRSLHVSSPNPVADGARIWGEITRQSAITNGLA